jgi:CheY-like chemotaxis protein
MSAAPTPPSAIEPSAQQAPSPHTSPAQERPSVPAGQDTKPLYSPGGLGGGDRTVKASPVSVPAGRALTGRLQLGRALRPLRQRRHSRTELALDEQRTAEATAELGNYGDPNSRLLYPVFRPVDKRWFDVDVVLEDDPGIQVWQDTVREFCQMLRDTGVFRDVRWWRLRLLKDSPPALENPAGRRVSAQLLAGGGVRRLVFFATHGSSLRWLDGSYARLLEPWLHTASLVLLHLLPRRGWKRTPLGDPHGMCRAEKPGAVTANLRIDPFRWLLAYEEGAPSLPAVPAVPLNAPELREWSHMLMARGRRCPVFFLDPAPPAAEQPPPWSIERAAANLRETAPEAFQLAVYLSAGTFTIPVARLVQEAKFGAQADTLQLGEMLLSGLVTVRPSQDGQTDPDGLFYEFDPAARRILMRSLRQADAELVAQSLERHVSKYMEQIFGRQVKLRALVPDQNGNYDLPEWAQPFARLGATLLGLAGEGKTAEELLSDFRANYRAAVVRRAAQLAASADAGLRNIDQELQRVLADARLLQRDSAGNWQFLPGVQTLLARLASESPLLGARLLWVDDHPENNAQEARMLRASGADIHSVANRIEARAEAEKFVYDVVISDMRRSQPDSGLLLLNWFRLERPNLPFILYSRHAERSSALSAGAFGATNDPNTLFELVRQAVASPVKSTLDRMIDALLILGQNPSTASSWLTASAARLAELVLDLASDVETLYSNHLRMLQAYAGSGLNQLILQDEKGQLTVLADMTDPGKARFVVVNPAGLIAQAVTQGKVIWAPDVSQMPGYIAAEPTTKAELVVPLVPSGQPPPNPLGAVNLEFTETNALSPEQIEWIGDFVTALADRIAGTPSPAVLAQREQSELLRYFTDVRATQHFEGHPLPVLQQLLNAIGSGLQPRMQSGTGGPPSWFDAEDYHSHRGSIQLFPSGDETWTHSEEPTVSPSLSGSLPLLNTNFYAFELVTQAPGGPPRRAMSYRLAESEEEFFKALENPAELAHLHANGFIAFLREALLFDARGAKDDYALVVGIGTYQVLPPFPGAVRNALDFAAWLTNPAGGRLPTDHVKYLDSPSLEAFDEAFASAVEPARRGSKGQRLYLYLAGNSVSSYPEDLLVLMPEATPQTSGLNIAVHEYLEFLQSLGHFLETVIVCDCKPIWSPGARLRKPPFAPPALSLLKTSSIAILGSWVDGPSEITRAFLEGMAGAAADSEGSITADSLRLYILERTRTGDPQAQIPVIIVSSSQPFLLGKTGRPFIQTGPMAEEVKFGGSLFGYTTLVREGGAFVALIGEGEHALHVGMRVVLRGDSRGYVPSGFPPGAEVTIAGFKEPFKDGETDHIVEVRDQTRLGWVKPSNIQRSSEPTVTISTQDTRIVTVSYRSLMEPFSSLTELLERTRGLAHRATRSESSALPLVAELESALQALQSAEHDPRVMTWTYNSMASLLQSYLADVARKEGKLQELDSFVLEPKFTRDDWDRWITSFFSWMLNIVSVPFWVPQVPPTPIADHCRVALLGNWGTSLYGAPLCAQSIANDPGGFDVMLHLGGIYYSGLHEEIDRKFLQSWPKIPSALNRALHGKPEMFSGGHGYFDLILPNFQQPASCFALQNSLWTLVGLDTAYHHGTELGADQLAWLRQLLAADPGRRVILFSYHSPFSLNGESAPPLLENMQSILESRSIWAWYWAEDPYCILYDPHPKWGFHGRCIGNGGLPAFRTHPAHRESNFEWERTLGTSGLPNGNRLDGPNDSISDPAGEIGVHGYSTLEFQGPAVMETVLSAHGLTLWTKRFSGPGDAMPLV